MKPTESRFAFFRQSGWMMLATTASGLFMYAVHLPAMARLPQGEYGVFNTLLQCINLMLIPAISLQIVFAQQTAAARSDREKRQLTGAIRGVLRCVLLAWLLLGVTGLFFQDAVVRELKLTNLAALWITAAAFLPTLALYLMHGLLQGAQNFLWLGWSAICNGLGRLAAVWVAVVWLHGHAAGAMSGALVGMITALAVTLWQTHAVWAGPSESFEWRGWVARVIPLTAGLAASQLMLAADMVIVQIFFPSDTGRYGAAGAIARGLVVFTGPVAMVMFPKIVHAAGRSGGAGLLSQALLSTGVLAGAAALACTLVPELPFRIVNPAYLPIAPLLPWFAWCMMPLTLTNVLINHLLARSEFRAVPWLLGIALIYAAVLTAVARSAQAVETLAGFKLIVQTLGGFNLLLLAAAAWFTWRSSPDAPTNPSGPVNQV